MQKNRMINLYNSWLNILYSLGDLNYQRRVWFRREGDEVDSYEDSIDEFFSAYDMWERLSNDPSCSADDKKVYSNLFKELKPLHDEIRKFRNNFDDLMDTAFEEKLITNKNWLQIVTTSQTISNFLKSRIEELEYER